MPPSRAATGRCGRRSTLGGRSASPGVLRAPADCRYTVCRGPLRVRRHLPLAVRVRPPALAADVAPPGAPPPPHPPPARGAPPLVAGRPPRGRRHGVVGVTPHRPGTQFSALG